MICTLGAINSHLSVVGTAVVTSSALDSAVAGSVATGWVISCGAVVSAVSPLLPQDESAKAERTMHESRIRDTILFLMTFSSV